VGQGKKGGISVYMLFLPYFCRIFAQFASCTKREYKLLGDNNFKIECNFGTAFIFPTLMLEHQTGKNPNISSFGLKKQSVTYIVLIDCA
jgi:hypothetical protein